MARKVLNAEEMDFLGSIEPKLKTAVEARWISYLPDIAIDRMLSIWEALTGSKRAYSRGCGTCALHLAIDIGKLYFAQKAAQKAAEPAEVAPEAPEAPKADNPAPAKKKTASGKNRG